MEAYILNQVLGHIVFAVMYLSSPSVLTLTPPSNTSRRKARSTRRPARHRKQPCIYAGVGLSRAGGWPAAA